MNVPGSGAAKRVALEGAGWSLVVLGVILMPLPGPGLLIVVSGVALLAKQYDWADRHLTRVRLRALREAARGVSGFVPIAISVLGMLSLVTAGVVWILDPPAPGWWPLPDSWWLPGGLMTGAFQIASALFALGLLVYSYRRFHGDPEELASLERAIAEADAAVKADRDSRDPRTSDAV